MNTHFLAFGTFGTMEILIVAILVLILFCSKKLPTFARSLGRTMGEFKKARKEFDDGKSEEGESLESRNERRP